MTVFLYSDTPHPVPMNAWDSRQGYRHFPCLQCILSFHMYGDLFLKIFFLQIESNRNMLKISIHKLTNF